jgi:hypothetical protein
MKLNTSLLNVPTHLADRKVSILRVEEKNTLHGKIEWNSNKGGHFLGRSVTIGACLPHNIT